MPLHHDGRLAQLVEHLPYKEGVTGSSPVSPTTSHDSPASLRYGSLAQLVEQLTFNQLVTGSNPVRPTIFLFLLSLFRLIILFLYFCLFPDTFRLIL